MEDKNAHIKLLTFLEFEYQSYLEFCDKEKVIKKDRITLKTFQRKRQKEIREVMGELLFRLVFQIPLTKKLKGIKPK